MSPLVQFVIVILIILAAVDGWRRGGTWQALVEALGMAAIIGVVLLLLRFLGATL
jgi:hypothetical protein